MEVLDEAHEYFLKTLCNKNRLKVLLSLMNGKKSVGKIVESTGMNQTTVSHALRRLHDCGFVEVEKNGKLRIYKLRAKTIKPLLKLMETHVKEYCAKRCVCER